MTKKVLIWTDSAERGSPAIVPDAIFRPPAK
jgi:hypothetical protein